MRQDILTERETEILEAVVQHFVLTGSPVGSRTISKKRKTDLSPATIRNVMSDLEDKGLLDHPHTSAGRVPTSKGYRHYVDHLVYLAQLSDEEEQLLRQNLQEFSGDVDYILEKTIQTLAKLSNQIGVLLTPKFESGVLEKLDITKVSSEKLLVVLTIKDGIVKTILLEIHHETSQNVLESVVHILNERLGGLKIREIKETFRDRLKDVIRNRKGDDIIRLFIESADKIFDFSRYANIKYSGTNYILSNPEFADVSKFSTLIELFEEKNIIIHMMEKRSIPPGLKITIGDENEEEFIQDCSIITAPYSIGDVDGLLGVIGPMRMAYRKIIPVVGYTAELVTRILSEK